MREYIVIRKLVNEGKFEEAIKKAKEMENGFAQSLFMSKIAFGIAIAGKVEEALKIASNIKISSEKVYTMVRISDLLMDRGEIEGAKRYWRRQRE